MATSRTQACMGMAIHLLTTLVMPNERLILKTLIQSILHIRVQFLPLHLRAEFSEPTQFR